MRLLFNSPFLYKHAEGEGGSGFTPEEAKELKQALGEAFDGKFSTLQEQMNENQKAVDHLLTQMKERGMRGLTSERPSFGEVFAGEIKTQFESQKESFEAMAKGDKDVKIKIRLKAVGDMSTGNIVGGEGSTTYSGRQILAQSQKINFRDLLHTVRSETGVYVSYKENGSEGSIAKQTEGSAKSQIDYDFAELKAVTGYVAGFARFSKQLMRHLPFLETTLPRLLMRDFYKAENAYFWDVFATQSTGFTTTLETKDPLQIIDVLMGRADQDFNNSYILTSHTEVGRILKELYNDQNYMGAGSVVGTQNGIVTIAGTPIVGASFAKSKDKILIVDADYVERVETEGLNVVFSYEDANNFTTNKITARVECMEELSILQPNAHSYLDAGNSSTS